MTWAIAGWMTAAVLLMCALILRHWHRWTAWADPEQDSWGHSFQIRRCKDRGCNKHQRKDCDR